MSYFLSDLDLKLNRITKIVGEEAEHIAKSRRIKIGEMINVQDPLGRRFAAEVTKISGQALEIMPKNEITAPPEPNNSITILQAVVKEKSLDIILQKATELGAKQIILWNAERTPEKITPKFKQKISRWEKITIEAAKQSDRQKIPVVTLADETALYQLAADQFDALFILDKNGMKSFDEVHEAHPNFFRIGILIGPEGGLTVEELERWSALKNSYLIKIGPRILRADTAAIASLSLVQALWGDLS